MENRSVREETAQWRGEISDMTQRIGVRNITIVHIIVGLLLLSTFLTAGMFTFHLGAWDLQKAQVDKIEQQAQDLQDILNAIDQTTKQQAIEGTERTKLLADVALLVEQQGNLSQQSREGLITAINDTYYVTIPNIHDILEEIGDNQTKLIRGHEQLIRGLLNGTVK